MKQEYKDKLPVWTNFKKDDNYFLTLSNDLDSLIGCKILEKTFGYRIGYFFDFKTLYKLENVDELTESIGVDIALANGGKTYDNHVSSISAHDTFNPNSANINNIEKIYGASDIYFYKYCGSTLLEILSIYNIPIPENEELQMVLLAIDSTYLGYYSRFSRDRDSNRKYLVSVLQFPQLYELQKRKTVNDFSNIINKYNLKANLYIEEHGYLINNKNLSNLQDLLLNTLGIDLSYPMEKFENIQTFKTLNFDIPNKEDITKYTKKTASGYGNHIYSLAMTGKTNISLSYSN